MIISSLAIKGSIRDKFTLITQNHPFFDTQFETKTCFVQIFVIFKKFVYENPFAHALVEKIWMMHWMTIIGL
jgi:hypothetical protein